MPLTKVLRGLNASNRTANAEAVHVAWPDIVVVGMPAICVHGP